MKVLIIDDKVTDLERLTSFATQVNVEYVSASSAREGIEKLRKHHQDVGAIACDSLVGEYYDVFSAAQELNPTPPEFFLVSSRPDLFREQIGKSKLPITVVDKKADDAVRELFLRYKER